MYQISVYSITSKLWRWELRSGGALLRCGTAPTRMAADCVTKAVLDEITRSPFPSPL